MFPHVTLLLVAFLLLMSTLASGGSISSSGLQVPVVYTCETLPADPASPGLKFRVGPSETLNAETMTVIENRGIALSPGAFPAIVTGEFPAASHLGYAARYVDVSGGILVDILSDARKDFWKSPRGGHVALWAPASENGFSAFIRCSVQPWSPASTQH